MQRALTGAACVMLLSCAQPALAADFHPLESLTLTGGVYEYDNIFIPAGVTLSFAGEDREATLRALDSLTLAGSLVAPGWTLILEAQHLQLSGQIEVGGDPTAPGGTLIVGRRGGLDGIVLLPGGNVSLGSGGSIVPQPVPTPRDFSLGGYIVFQDTGNLIVRSDAGSGSTHTIQTPVPEPETWAILLAGLGLVVFSARLQPARGWS